PVVQPGGGRPRRLGACLPRSSPARPVMLFPPLIQFAGFAADGGATATRIDGPGNTVISAPVSQNLFASRVPGPFPSVVAVEALDTHGNVLATEHRPGR